MSVCKIVFIKCHFQNTSISFNSCVYNRHFFCVFGEAWPFWTSTFENRLPSRVFPQRTVGQHKNFKIFYFLTKSETCKIIFSGKCFTLHYFTGRGTCKYKMLPRAVKWELTSSLSPPHCQVSCPWTCHVQWYLENSNLWSTSEMIWISGSGPTLFPCLSTIWIQVV